MKRILISGYYGFNNAGDEAILYALCQLFAPYDTEVSVLVSEDLYHNMNRPPKTLHRMAPLQIVKALKQTDLFISGGGGLFQDVTGLGSIPYYGGLIYLAHLMKVPTMIFGQGIGPVQYPANRWILRHLIKHVARIAVRDPESVEALQEMGIPNQKLFQTADPVLTLQPTPKAQIIEYIKAEGLDPFRPIIGVSIRPWKTWFEKQLKSFTSVISQFALAHDAQILFIPFQPQSDRWLCQEAAYSMTTRPDGHTPSVHILKQNYSPTDMLGIIGLTDMMVGMRLHSLIMAAKMLVPAVGVVYDPKVRLFSESVGYPYVSSVTALSHSQIFNQYLTDTWQNREEVQNKLTNLVPNLQNRVYDAAQIALKLLGIHHDN